MSKHDILVRPFELRRYIEHRKKVELASPAIDNETPLERRHVMAKLKKQLWENERKEQIKKENFRLLQSLGRIMQVNRIDNHWIESQIQSYGN